MQALTAISGPELGTLGSVSEHRQLLTERKVLERDSSVSAADQHQGSDQHDERGQHPLSCHATDARINRLGWRSDSGEAHVARLL